MTAPLARMRQRWPAPYEQMADLHQNIIHRSRIRANGALDQWVNQHSQSTTADNMHPSV